MNFSFSLVPLSLLQGSQIRTQEGRGNFSFLSYTDNAA